MRFFKYHALGNDYIVMMPADFPSWETPGREQIRLICHRNFGVGSDGILWGPLPSQKADCALRIFNPDGSEAEKSGNGLRIFSRFLWDQKLVSKPRFSIQTAGGVVEVVVADDGREISIDMGCVSFSSDAIPVAGPKREVIGETLNAGGQPFSFCAATIGNPHCVIHLPAISAELAKSVGPIIEMHPSFPNRTNVQFMQAIDRANIRIEIWERGAGYTLASGSSSCAAAAVAFRLGIVDSKVTVHMPGGTIGIEIGPGFSVKMTGPVTSVAEGYLRSELFSHRLA